MGSECETKFKNLHDEIEKINEEIRELKSEIKKTKINSWSTNPENRIVTKVKRK